ncbi:MAG: hypothetical protein Q9M29_07670 [Mariprofundaceae bacterium]|nr:hypothetical protein [Mariprofundaceae bacterium]
MIGIDRTTGRVIADTAYLKDRIASCLGMRRGTHPMRRLKGSRIPELIDRPVNQATLFEMQVAAIEALSHPENGLTDLNLRRVVVDRVEAGRVHLTLVFQQNGQQQTLSGVVVSR